MSEKNIDISKHVSRRYMPFNGEQADIVVNMCEYPLPGSQPKNVIVWKVVDPYGKPLEAFQKTRDAIEKEVMSLILDIRKGKK